MSPTLLKIFWMLLTAGLMWPSEGAIEGSGLHLSALWLLTAIFVVWSADPRTSLNALPKNFRMAGLGWLLLVGGFWCSTAAVFHAHGDRRAALNLCFEWTAIGAAWWATIQIARRELERCCTMRLVIGLCAGAALLGIIQHHVSYAHHADWYRNGRAILDAAVQTDDLQTAMQAREVLAEFRAMDVPVEGAGRQLFERRLLSSSEPVGPFALANTLAGFLALGLVLLVGMLIDAVRSQPRVSLKLWLRIMPLMLVIGYCLVLTKSRTSWVACGTGLSCLLFGRGISRRMLARVAIGVVAMLLTVVAIGIGTGSLDREVVLESPRSLQFRLLYWMGAAGVIGDSPVFGSGPGNFRQAYLIHKSVESSEEILDPHNVVLDAWCSAGVLGLLGLALIGWPIVNSAIAASQKSNPKVVSNAGSGINVFVGILCGALLHVSWQWLQGGDFIDASAGHWSTSRSIVFFVPAGAVLALFCLPQPLSVSAHLMAAAALTLLVHLLGAGGLQITNIGLVLAVFSGCLFAAQRSSTEEESRGDVKNKGLWNVTGYGIRGVLAGSMAAALAVAVIYGILPVQRTNRLLSLAKSLETERNFRAASRTLAAAATLDPLSVSLRQRRAELLAYEFSSLREPRAHTEGNDGSTVLPDQNDVLAAADELVDADRRNWSAYVLRGNVHLAAAGAGMGEANRNAGLTDLEFATRLYPTNTELWVTLADAYDTQNREAECLAAVARALMIDKSNREWGHIDRYLSEQTLQWLKEKSEDASPSLNSQ